MAKIVLLLTIASDLSTAFVQQIPQPQALLRYSLQLQTNNEKSPSLRTSTTDDLIILPAKHSKDNENSVGNREELILSSNKPSKGSDKKVVLPTDSQKSLFQPRTSIWSRLQKSFKRQRPGFKFRATLLAVLASAAAITLRGPRSLLLVTNWIGLRGFQGLAAFGRTVAYAWAVLVAYPRLLDRRAADRRERRRERELDSRRNELIRLAAEVTRLRQELSSLDAEIRSFRREIIALKAADDVNIQVQQAIDDEMAYLKQLKLDTQTALVAARQVWAEARAQSPPDAWPGSMPP